MSLNDLNRRNGCYSAYTEFGSFGANYVIVVEGKLCCLRQKCRPNSPVCSNIWLMAIFLEVSENEFVRERLRLSKAIIWCTISGKRLTSLVVQFYLGFCSKSGTLAPKANSAFHPSGFRKWVPALARKAKAGMVHSVSGWTRGVQVKLWDPLSTRAIPKRLRGVFTTRRGWLVASACVSHRRLMTIE